MPTDQTSITLELSYPEQDSVSLRPAEIAAFCDYCRSVKPVGDFGDRADFDVFKLRPWLGHIIILEDLWPENDFLYRMYGTKIVEAIGWDMTGRRLSDYEPVTHSYNLSLYRDCVQRRHLIFSANQRVHGRFRGTWHRLVCPVRADDKVQVVSCAYLISKVEHAAGAQDQGEPGSGAGGQTCST